MANAKTTRKPEPKPEEASNDEAVGTAALDEALDRANATMPEGVELEIVVVPGKGKRIDLVRGDAVTRFETGLKANTAIAMLDGIAKGRAIQ